MAPKKKVTGLIKLQIKAGAANPAPPIGPALGQHGVNIMEFCKAYNAATESQRGNVIPVEITVYEDRSFTFILKTPPAAELIKKAAGVAKGSGDPAHHQGRQAHQGPGARDRREEAGRPERERHRGGHRRSSPAPPVRWASRSRGVTHGYQVQGLPGRRREDRGRQVLHAHRGRRAREGDRLGEVRLDRRGRAQARRRPAQGGPDGARHRHPAARHRQDRPRHRVRDRPRRRGRASRPAPTRSAAPSSSRRSPAAGPRSTRPSRPPSSWARSVVSARCSARAA